MAENKDFNETEVKETAPTSAEKAETPVTANENGVIFDEEKPEAETDKALESFLSHENDEKASAPAPKKRISKGVLAIIISVLVVAALVAVLLIIRSTPAVGTSTTDTDPASITLSVNEDGEHEATVEVDENGEIVHNNSGTLLSYVPADISTIHVENEGGSFDVNSETPEGEATVYTLIGFEDFDLQEGIADDVANDACLVEFLEIASADANLADFGLENPRATAKVTFNDETTATIYVGNVAAAEAGTYISFGSNSAVYLVEDDSVDSFLYNITDFISSVVNSSADNTEDSEFITLTISGSHFPEPITMVPNTDEAIDAAYLVTEPRRMYASATEGNDITGSIRGIYAESVVCVNPSESQLESYGISDPYAKIVAEYPDITVNLSASAPGDDGLIYLYNPDTDVIYTIQLSAVSWAVTNIESLVPENVISARLAYIDGVSFTSGDTSFDIDVKTTTSTIEGENDTTQEVNTTVATYGDTELEIEYFSIFFQNLNGIKIQSSETSSGTELMRFTLSYSTDRASDTVVIYSDGSAQYTAELNGELVGTVSKSYIDSLIEGANSLIAGGIVNSL